MARRITLALFAVAFGILAVPAVASAFDVTGTKFEDLDADGVFDAGEPGVAGVTIYRDADNDNVFDAGEASTTTTATGTYSLTVPNNQASTIREVLPAGYECSHPSTNFANCEHAVSGPPNNTKPDRNFGNFRRATISGSKFDDLDADGTFDAGEPGLSGVTIYLDANGNNTLDGGETSTTTDGSGNWSFGNLVPGTYTVREVLPAGYSCSTPGGGNFASCEFTETLTSNETDNAGQVFGNFTTASISGTKFEDLDGDGAFDAGEPPVSGVTIYLDLNDNDELTVGEPSTTTDGSGNWSFTGLNPGTYTVRENLPAGFSCSAPSFNFANCEFSETLTSGESDNTGQDFGNFQQATISGTKFEDLDGDGAFDAGEPPVAGVTIYIDANANDALDGGEVSTTTDGSGNWSLIGLAPGTYTVREVLPTGYQCSAPSTNFANCEFSVTVTSGQTDSTGQDFGNFQPATFSGTKFEDMDADGVLDAGDDLPLSNVTIYIDANGNDELDGGETSVQTDGTGAWSFTGLAPGTYTVREVLPAGYECSAPSTTFANCEFTETLTSGETENTGNDFGNFQRASISGKKFEDLDAGGSDDGGTDPPLSGVTIYIDENGNDTLDGGEPTDTTDASGNWSFTNLVPGDYSVREVLPAGYTCSAPGGGNFANCEFNETLTSGESSTGNAFGNFTTASISGTKFDDLDADGTLDAGEPGLNGITIYLDANDNDTFDPGETSTTTSGGGSWSFTGLNPGTVRVREVLPAGSTCSTPGGENFANCEFVDFLTSGENNTGNDFGNFSGATFSGTKFDDLDGDGVLDGGEPGVSGVTIYIDADGDNALDGGETQTTTDGTGAWSFTGLRPGTYTVREVPLAGTNCTTPGGGDFANCEFTETLTSGETSSGHDFGNATEASISGTKFEDIDADGTSDGGTDPPFSGVTIYVDLDNDDQLDAGEPQTTSDGTGSWSFTGLAPGTYTVREAPGAYNCSAPSAVFANCEFTETLSPAENDDTGQDFGNWRPASISGTKFSDLDNDGALDAGEPGLSGVTIYLDANNNNALDVTESQTTTDGTGAWSFTGLAPGSHTVREVLPAGTSCTTPGGGNFANCEFAVTLVSNQTDDTGQVFGNFVTPPPGGDGGGSGTVPGTSPADTRPFCGGARATIVGTSAGERIRGTAGNDVIIARGGSDRVSSGDGKDKICGLGGKDTLKGGAGKDVLYGGGAKDKLVGGAGKDLLFGGGGADTCFGSRGSDRGKSCSRTKSIP